MGPRAPAADRDLVHRADRRDLRRRAGEEELVGDVQHLARDALLDDLDALAPRQGDDGVARDPGQDRGDEGRRDQDALLDEEEVLAAALGEVPFGIEGDPLGRSPP